MNLDNINLIEGSTNYNLVFASVTASQRAALTNVETGEVVYQTDGTAGLYIYNGLSWNQVGAVDVVEANNYSSLPTVGSVGTVYIARDTSALYRWNGVAYVALTTLNTAKTDSANTFTGNQTITGTLSVSGNITASGYSVVSVDNSGKIDPTKLPAIAITSTYVVNDVAATSANIDTYIPAAVKGDVAVLTNISQTFILASTSPNIWVELIAPTANLVSLINNKPGPIVSLVASDVGAVGTSAVGTANGIATLDSNGHLSATQIPTISQANVTNLTTDLASKVTANTAITGSTATKVTFDTKGLITGSSALVSTDIPSLDASIITSGSLSTAQIPTLAQSKITNLTTDLASKVTANTAITGSTATKLTFDSKGLITGGAALVSTDIPALDASIIATGTVSASRLPAITMNNTFVIGVQADLTGLTTAVKGDVAIATTDSKTFILSDVPASTASNWKTLLSPTGGITSFQGRVDSAATLTLADVDGVLVAPTGVTVGSTYNNVTLSAKGRITAASNISYATLDVNSRVNASVLPAFTGDASTTAGSSTLSVDKIKGVTLSTTAPSSNQVLTYNGTSLKAEWATPTIGTSITGMLKGNGSALVLATAGTDYITPTGTETLTNKTYNGLALTSLTTGYTIAGGTTSKTLTINNSLTLAGTDGTTFNTDSALKYQGDFTGTLALPAASTSNKGQFYIATSAGSTTGTVLSLAVKDWALSTGSAWVKVPNSVDTTSNTFTATQTINVTAGSALTTTGGNITTDKQLVSSIATGTSPLVVSSTTVVPNLNVQVINGVTVAGTAAAGNILAATSATAAAWSVPSFASLSANTFTGNQTAPVFVSTATTGTAPFTVSSTTVVPNLNVAKLNGTDIGNTAPTANQVLTYNGTSLKAEWTTPTSGGGSSISTVASTTLAANTTLTSASPKLQQVTAATGSSWAIALPAVSTLTLGGPQFIITHTGAQTAANITINSSTGSLVTTLSPGQTIQLFLNSITTEAATSWIVAELTTSTTVATAGTVARRDTEGSLTALNFYSTSDIRTKENIQDLIDSDILKLQPKTFNFIDDDTQKTHFGLIAQDVQKIFPMLINTDDNDMLSVNYIEIISLLLAKVKEQNDDIQLIKLKLGL